jgi:hypothetical protein
VTVVTWRQVAAWRTRRHSLAERRPKEDALDVVAELCGLHAQVMSSAEMTLHARVDGLPNDAVEKALWTDRTLVKTWSMRGTLHLLPASEYPWWQSGFGTYRHYRRPVWYRNFHITEPELDQLLEAVTEALEDRLLSREELGDEITRVTGSAELGDKLRESWGAYLKPASFQGRLVFGPNSAKNARFTRPDTWLHRDLEFGAESQAAVQEIALRYLATHGPATREDFARWWGVSAADGGRVLRALGERIEPVDVEGEPYWARAQDVPELVAAERVRVVRLLPAFDQYVIAATRQVDHLLAGGSPDRVYRAQGWLSPVLLIDGMLAGVWRAERVGKRPAVSVEPFLPVSATTRESVRAEVDRLTAGQGLPAEVEWRE